MLTRNNAANVRTHILGPIFLHIGSNEAESANAISIEDAPIVKLAAETNALLFNIEMRFFGDSHPTVFVECFFVDAKILQYFLQFDVRRKSRLFERAAIDRRRERVHRGDKRGAQPQ